ncbi:protein SEY1 [Multifurca ochricompacta]|uniref:Protein SEY1 n=1 Tax=Multifurca ochricompacta TaxID=376703 RepID=A0AAD4LZW3_9AGAM|nr:protein SEY1 [Multifurca ochricompacta]
MPTPEILASNDALSANTSSPSKPTLNGHPPNGTSDRSQIINDEKQFIPNLNDQIAAWGLRDAGFDYNLVAVFGSQSTGKSTLLNRLFGTNFDVMDESKRQQTTKGIWMCRGRDMNVLVMDVEGTDGRERGEDQDFERKSALFSLASSEVLIVNLWEHQVGLYQGANMGLLKTVFEVNLGLFGKKTQESASQRTLLLFVIRDHIGTTPLANLQATVTSDLQRIWDTLSKPAELQDRKLTDYFDLSFTALPHKILAAERFESDIRALRGRFTDKSRDDFVFKPAYHKRIPADGVAFYMEGIWEQVQTNKDLDLPTQQELLAQFRCDEISAGALAEFNEQAKSQKRPIEAGQVISGLGEMMRSWRSQALSRYDRDASRYHQAVYKRKRADLVGTLDSTLSPLFVGQLKNLHKAALVSFKAEIVAGLKVDGYNFADVVSKARASAEALFSDGAREIVVVEDDATWQWEEELRLLREEIRSVADQLRKDETKKMVNTIERKFKTQIAEPVEVQLGSPTPEIWDNVLRTFKETLARSEASYLTKARSFDCTEEENDEALTTLRHRAWAALRVKIDEQTADAAILTKLRTYFEERFRYDEQGVPRVWKPDDDIDGAFKKAKDVTLELISLYAKIEPQDPELAYTPPEDVVEGTEAPGLVVFSETKVLELGARFRREADAHYVEAKRSTVASIAQIPYWIYGALVVLGWNEAMMILFNPLYVALLLVLAGGAWIIVQLNLAGPLMHVGSSIAFEVKRQAESRLREHFAEPLRAQAHATAIEDEDDTREVRHRKPEAL